MLDHPPPPSPSKINEERKKRRLIDIARPTKDTAAETSPVILIIMCI